MLSYSLCFKGIDVYAHTTQPEVARKWGRLENRPALMRETVVVEQNFIGKHRYDIEGVVVQKVGLG